MRDKAESYSPKIRGEPEQKKEGEWHAVVDENFRKKNFIQEEGRELRITQRSWSV